jgi:hypothetical protein
MKSYGANVCWDCRPQTQDPFPGRDERIVAMWRQGMTLDAIGREFGITRERVRQLLMRAVPEEVKSVRRERRERGLAARTCPECGGPKSPNGQACRSCRPRGEYGKPQTWSREAIIDCIKAWVDIHGEPPGALDWAPAMARRIGREDIAAKFYAEGCWPYVGTVRERFGNWNVAISAAGFTPRKMGGRRPGGHPPAVVMV